jgi:hypothetical protein
MSKATGHSKGLACCNDATVRGIIPFFSTVYRFTAFWEVRRILAVAQ